MRSIELSSIGKSLASPKITLASSFCISSMFQLYSLTSCSKFNLYTGNVTKKNINPRYFG